MTKPLRSRLDTLFAATNAFDIDAALDLFAPNAVIDDPSVGAVFSGHAGIRNYLERFFLGYHTATRILTMQPEGQHMARLRVDFTGDFGHETGLLDITFAPSGAIRHIHADLE